MNMADWMSGVQKKRLSEKSDEVLAALNELHVARIKDDEGRIYEGHLTFESAVRRMEWALNAGGLLVGDVVCVVADGPYKGKQAKINGIEFGGRLRLLIDGRTVLPWPHEVQIVV
jgi:hypothetical protein